MLKCIILTPKSQIKGAFEPKKKKKIPAERKIMMDQVDEIPRNKIQVKDEEMWRD